MEGMFDHFLATAQIQSPSAMGLSMRTWLDSEFQVRFHVYLLRGKRKKKQKKLSKKREYMPL
jgi:hypothetical protein